MGEKGKDILEGFDLKGERYPCTTLALILRCLGDAIAANGGETSEVYTCYCKCGELLIASFGEETLEYSITQRKIRAVVDKRNRDRRKPSKTPKIKRNHVGGPESPPLKSRGEFVIDETA